MKPKESECGFGLGRADAAEGLNEAGHCANLRRRCKMRIPRAVLPAEPAVIIDGPTRERVIFLAEQRADRAHGTEHCSQLEPDRSVLIVKCRRVRCGELRKKECLVVIVGEPMKQRMPAGVRNAAQRDKPLASLGVSPPAFRRRGLGEEPTGSGPS